MSLYLCGATVQAPPHIGHIRSGVNFDILARWLRASGYESCSAERHRHRRQDSPGCRREAVPWWAVAQRNQRAFTRAYEALGCLPPDVEPRATGHVPEMIAIMRRLIDRGHAYVSDGDVYFDVRSYPAYGALSGQRLEQMRPADDTDTRRGKRDLRDFALWKAAKPGEPPGTRRGGRAARLAPGMLGHGHQVPGRTSTFTAAAWTWCSPPRERARPVPRGRRRIRPVLDAQRPLGVAGEKMSKSLGNSLLVAAMVTQVRPVELRYYLGQAHYRSAMDTRRTRWPRRLPPTGGSRVS